MPSVIRWSEPEELDGLILPFFSLHRCRTFERIIATNTMNTNEKIIYATVSVPRTRVCCEDSFWNSALIAFTAPRKQSKKYSGKANPAIARPICHLDNCGNRETRKQHSPIIISDNAFHQTTTTTKKNAFAAGVPPAFQLNSL